MVRGGREGERGQSRSKKARSKRAEKVNSPFYSESSIPGYCLGTVGRA